MCKAVQQQQQQEGQACPAVISFGTNQSLCCGPVELQALIIKDKRTKWAGPQHSSYFVEAPVVLLMLSADLLRLESCKARV